jgi:ribosomal protein L34E
MEPMGPSPGMHTPYRYRNLSRTTQRVARRPGTLLCLQSTRTVIRQAARLPIQQARVILILIL